MLESDLFGLELTGMRGRNSELATGEFFPSGLHYSNEAVVALLLTCINAGLQMTVASRLGMPGLV